MYALCEPRPDTPDDRKGLVIFLGGTTSSGKTTLVNGLRGLCNEFNYLAEDDEYPLGTDGPSSRDLTKDDLAHKLNHYAMKLASKGKTVIIDEVDIFHCYINDASRVFAGANSNFRSVLVLMYCPFRDYPLRVGKRNNNGNPNDRRSVWRSLIQWAIMYEGNPTEEPGSLEFVSTAAFDDTLRVSAAIGLGTANDCRMQSEMTKKFILQLLPFDQYDGLWIRPRDDYDFVFCSAGQKDPIKNFKMKFERFVNSGMPSVLESPRWDKDVDNLNISCGYCSISGVKTAEQILMSQLLCEDCLNGLAAFTRKKSLLRKQEEDEAQERHVASSSVGTSAPARHAASHAAPHAALTPYKRGGRDALHQRPRDKPVQAVMSWLFGCMERPLGRV